MSQPAAPRTMRQLAESFDLPADEIDRAHEDGTLALLIIERVVFPDEPHYTQDEIASRSGLGEEGKRFWRALGFPDPRPDEKLFTDVDLEMLRTVEQMLSLGIVEPEVAMQMTRVIGSSMDRIAETMVAAIANRIQNEAELHPNAAMLEGTEPAVFRAGLVVPMFPKILDYVWRRHVQAAARRRLVRDSGAAGEGSAKVAVGFADLVGFTALSQQLDDDELARVVDRFEQLAHDIVTGAGARVVKMIGDEVMFAAPTVVMGVEIALALADAYRDDESLSDVRVGVAYGQALEREGDLYGPIVNLASRMVSIAYAGSVVVSADVHDALADVPGLRWKSLRTRRLKDIGRVQLYVVRRSSDDFDQEGVFERAWRRRGTIRDRVADLLEPRADEQPE